MMDDVGTPLEVALGGSNIVAVSTGASVCGKVLEACGFDVSEQVGFAKPAESHTAQIRDLLVNPNITTPYKPR